jgi:hypothetical protein
VTYKRACHLRIHDVRGEGWDGTLRGQAQLRPESQKVGRSPVLIKTTGTSASHSQSIVFHESSRFFHESLSDFLRPVTRLRGTQATTSISHQKSRNAVVKQASRKQDSSFNCISSTLIFMRAPYRSIYSRDQRLEHWRRNSSTMNRSDNIAIKRHQRAPRDITNDPTFDSCHSSSTKDHCDFLTWQMYHRIVASRLSSNRRRTTPQPRAASKRDRQNLPSKLDSSQSQAVPSCENDMIFDLEL